MSGEKPILTRTPSSKLPSAQESISAEYEACAERGEQLIACLKHELGTLVVENDIALGGEIEGRVKKLDSILEKVTQKKTSASNPFDLNDFVGIRIILLFRKDLEKVNKIVSKNFDILEFEETKSRLNETEFGYQSNHYLIKLKKKWCSIPSYRNLTGIIAELQVRTMAQHIWASISHKLQYKNELSIPSPMRRTIHRVSALLETVDLEFDRVLKERTSYLKNINLDNDQEINVDVLVRLAEELFPPDDDKNGFERLMRDLRHFKLDSVSKLKALVMKHHAKVMEADKLQAKTALDEPGYRHFHDKAAKGRFFSHVGLFRQALRQEFGDSAVDELFNNDNLLDDIDFEVDEII